MNNISSLSVTFDSKDKGYLLRDILDKIVRDNISIYTRGQAMSLIYDFYLKNIKQSRSVKGLVNRSEHEKRKTIEKELTEKITQEQNILTTSRIKHILNVVCLVEKEELNSRITKLIDDNSVQIHEHEKMKLRLIKELENIIEVILKDEDDKKNGGDTEE